MPHDHASHDHHHHHTGDHQHDADHGGNHHHHVPDSNRAFAIGVSLNIGFVLIELGFGWWTNSLALLADAGHNFGDVIGLLLAWGAARLALKAPSAHFTYGLGSSTILAALSNAVLLLVATGAIVWEAAQRLYGATHAEPVTASIVIAVALAGVVVNGATAMLFMRGREHDLNRKGAYLHMAADAAVSLGVAIAGGLILLTNWMWLDPVISIVIALVIVWSTWFLLRESLRLALQAAPRGIDVDAVKKYLTALPGVNEVHDLHIWGISTTQSALTVHLVMTGGHPGDEFFANLADELQSRFRIGHPTVQIETGSAAVACRLAPSNVL
jgi:cobalt-zinc-cadmium efflux system protein